MEKIQWALLSTLLSLLALCASALAGIPQTINYQGYLKNGSGVPVSAPTNISFRLYSSTRPSSGVLWSETRSVTPVNGIYSVELGSSTPFGPLPFDTPYFLGIAAGADPEMTPRQPLTSAPYALRAGTAENAGSAMTIAGQDLTQLDSRYIDPAQPARPSPLQIATMRWDQVGRSGKFTVGSLPVGIAFDGANIWVANRGGTTVSKLRASDGALLGNYTVGSGPNEIAFDGANIWTTNISSNNVTKLRASDGALLGTYPVGNNPWGIAFDGTNIWVGNRNDNTVTKLRASDGLLQAVYPAGGNGVIHLTFDGSNIWAVNIVSNNVTKLRASDGFLLGTYAVGSNPWMSAFDGTNIWVPNSNSGSITKLRASDGFAVATYQVATHPDAVAFDGTNIWVSDEFGQKLYKLRTDDGAVLASYPLAAAAIGMAFDGANIWTALFYSGQVAKIPVTPDSSQPYISNGAIASAMIADTAVTTAKIADLSVTTAKIADGSVTAAKLDANAATTAVIANGAVTDAKISGPISGSKISTTVHMFGGNPGVSIAGGATGYVFVGPTVTVNTLAGQRMVGAGQAPLGTSSTTPVYFRYDLCYRQSGTGNALTNFTGGNYSAGSINNTAGRSSFAAAATTVPGAGSWEVGYCVFNSSASALDNLNFVNGWIMLTN